MRELRFFGDSDERSYAKARKRLGRTSQAQVADWADTSLWAVQESLEAHRRTSDQAALVQARTGAVGLLAAVDTLLDNKP